MWHRLDRTRNLALRALREGGRQIGPTIVEWDVSGSCSDPVTRAIYARGDRETDQQGKGFTVYLTLRCRKCPHCLALRKYGWAQRMRTEIARARRTWFGTFTFRPDEHYRLEVMARKRLARGGVVYDSLNDDEKFRERHKEAQVELTKFFKRLRFETGADLRYILVCEAHRNGLPHYHALIHERDVPVRYAALKGQWRSGHCMFKLVDVLDGDKHAAYLAKYLAKSALARVRASVRYGKNDVLGDIASGNAQREETATPERTELIEVK